MFSGNLCLSNPLENASAFGKAKLFVEALRVADLRGMFYVHEWLPLLAVSKQFIGDDTFVQEIRAAVHSIQQHHDEILDATYDHNMQIYDEIVSSISCLDHARDFPSAIEFPALYIGSHGGIGLASSSDDGSSD